MTSILSEYPIEQTDPTQAYFHQILVAYCKDVKRNQPFAREKIQDLLKAGLNINYCVDNKTFLSYLVQSTSLPIIKWFIDLGATAPYILFDACCGQTDSQWHKRQRDEQNTVIRTTFYHGLYDNTDTFSWLVKHFPDQLHVLHPNGMNLLQWVASEGSLDKIKCVLPYMVDTIHTKSEDGSSAYSWSVRYSEWNVGGKLVPSYPILDQMNQVLQERREIYRDMLEIIGSRMCAGSNSFLQEEIVMYIM